MFINIFRLSYCVYSWIEIWFTMSRIKNHNFILRIFSYFQNLSMLVHIIFFLFFWLMAACNHLFHGFEYKISINQKKVMNLSLCICFYNINNIKIIDYLLSGTLYCILLFRKYKNNKFK